VDQAIAAHRQILVYIDGLLTPVAPFAIRAEPHCAVSCLGGCLDPASARASRRHKKGRRRAVAGDRKFCTPPGRRIAESGEI